LSRAGRVDTVVGGEGWTAKEMLCCLIIASSVDTPETVVALNTVKIAGKKQAVARPQLSDGDALASGPVKSPVELQTHVSHAVAVDGI